MLRKQCEIKDRAEIENILTRVRVGRLATIGNDGYPYITPVNYVWWQGSVYFHCARRGEKLDNIRNDDKVCFEVDIPLAYLDLEYQRMTDGEEPSACKVHQFYHSVIIRGRAEVVEDIGEKVEALNALVASHEEEAAFEKIAPSSEGVAMCHVVAIRVESISGKSDLAQKKSLEEKEKIAGYLGNRGLAGDSEAAALIGKGQTDSPRKK